VFFRYFKRYRAVTSPAQGRGGGTPHYFPIILFGSG